MSMVDEIANELDAVFDWLIQPESAPDGTPGNLYRRTLANDPDDAVGLYEYGGRGPTQTLKNENPTERPRLQVLVRHSSVETAELWSKRIQKHLITVNNSVIDGVRYLKISSVSNPSPIGPDSENRYRYTTNYQVEKEWSPDA